MKISWSGTLATGSAHIDTEHKELFQRINRLLEAQEKGLAGWSEIGRIVQFLTDYVVFHFGNEERLMDLYGYSGSSGHKAQHAQFVKLFLRLKERLLSEGPHPGVQQETRDLLIDWLFNHIKYSDRALGAYLQLKKQSADGGRPASPRHAMTSERAIA